MKGIIALLLLFAFGAGSGMLLKGRVVSVGDGDSLTVFSASGGRERIRLYGIDCPELDQRGGKEARAFTHSLVFLKEVSLTVMDKDGYGRTVALVTLPDGRSLNEELLRNGHAWVYPAYCKTARCAYWRKLSGQAKANRLGLWRDARPLPPWLWRKR